MRLHKYQNKNNEKTRSPGNEVANWAKFGTGLFLLNFMTRFGVWFRLVPPF